MLSLRGPTLKKIVLQLGMVPETATPITTGGIYCKCIVLFIFWILVLNQSFFVYFQDTGLKPVLFVDFQDTGLKPVLFVYFQDTATLTKSCCASTESFGIRTPVSSVTLDPPRPPGASSSSSGTSTKLQFYWLWYAV